MYQQFFVLVLILPYLNSQQFTSVSHLYSSVQAGRDLAAALRNYTKVEKLKTISNKMHQYTLNIQKDPNRYIANGAFLFIKISEVVISGQVAQTEFRISKGMFLYQTHAKAVKRIKKRIQAITGLSVTEFEPMHVANYGIGGYYDVHSDNFNVKDHDELSYGNRIATWLNYMSDVEEGATVYPQLGVRILPKKGAAAFWYNLYRNGSANTMTHHGACPVLIGSKWVSVYWIGEKEQLFNRPGSTNPKE